MSAARELVVDCRMWRSSGVGTYLRALLPRLHSRLPNLDWLLLTRPDEAPLEGLPIPRQIVSAGVYAATEQPALWRAIPKSAALVWSPHINLPMLARTPKVVTVHDAYYLEPEWTAGVRLDKRLYTRTLMRAIAKQAAEVICVSDFTGRQLKRYLPNLRAPVTVVHNAADAAWSEPPVAASPHERPYVICVGNVKPHKNLARALDAFARIAASVPHDLVVVGKNTGFAGGSGIDAGLVERLGCRLHFTGFVSDAALRGWVAHADLLCFVSLYEGFGLPPLEAMSVGTPVLASRAASIPEVCGEAAEYCDARDPGDIASTLLRLLLNPTHRAALAAAGRVRVAAFDWDKAADQTAAVLDRAYRSSLIGT